MQNVYREPPNHFKIYLSLLKERNPKDEMGKENNYTYALRLVEDSILAGTVKTQTDLTWISDESQMIEDTKYSNSEKSKTTNNQSQQYPIRPRQIRKIIHQLSKNNQRNK